MKKPVVITLEIKPSDCPVLVNLLNYGDAAHQDNYGLVKRLKDQMIFQLTGKQHEINGGSHE